MKAQPIRLGTITGELRQPKPTGRLIVICHGYQDSRANPTIVAVTEMLNQKGYATFTFNFSPNRGGIDIEQQVRDTRQIARHFKAYGEIVLLATSFAALSATIVTVQSRKIVGLITINGFFGTGELGGKHHRNYLLFRALALVSPNYRKIFKYFKHELRPELITAHALVIHSQADTYVSIKQSQRFYAQLVAPKQFFVLKAANHGVTATKDRRVAVEAIHTWMQTIK